MFDLKRTAHKATRYHLFLFLIFLCRTPGEAETLQTDVSAVHEGPAKVSVTETSLLVQWPDATNQLWTANFSRDSTKPLITSIGVNGQDILRNASPVYRGSTGKRTGGWDAFFDFPPAAREGTHNYVQRFHPTRVVARSVGDRIEVEFDGMELGIFSGRLRYVFYPKSSLIQQVALLRTSEPDTAYIYDAGLQMSIDADRRPGVNMASEITYYDADAKLKTLTPPYGSERHTLPVHYRAIATRSGRGSVVAFPSPHRYLFAHDYTTNMGYSWYSSWRGKVGIGIEQPLDDNTQIYPWINAPPGTEQEMGIFFLLGSGSASETLEHALAYTHHDRYQHLDGYMTFAPHWHLAFTEQAIANGPQWVPPFKPAMQGIGLDAAMIMDFHIDLHPADTTGLRFKELDAYYRACRNQSDDKFLLIPAEEADVYLGGHWGLTFPKPVYWLQSRRPDEPFASKDPTYGTVYRVGSAEEMWKLVQLEHGLAYETHPRTKGSTGFPDKILNTEYFRSPLYFGTGWKAMPSDLSSPRLGERAFKVLDDLNNLGLHKIMMGEVDVFQISATDELYAHMNVNYVPLAKLPDFDHSQTVLEAWRKGQGFISTGEVLLPRISILPGADDTLRVSADVLSTFPLRLAEVVWGDGKATHRQIIPLETAHEFEQAHFEWQAAAPHWTWARVAVWDIAAGGAFTNPIWRAEPTAR